MRVWQISCIRLAVRSGFCSVPGVTFGAWTAQCVGHHRCIHDQDRSMQLLSWNLVMIGWRQTQTPKPKSPSLWGMTYFQILFKNTPFEFFLLKSGILRKKVFGVRAGSPVDRSCILNCKKCISPRNTRILTLTLWKQQNCLQVSGFMFRLWINPCAKAAWIYLWTSHHLCWGAANATARTPFLRTKSWVFRSPPRPGPIAWKYSFVGVGKKNRTAGWTWWSTAFAVQMNSWHPASLLVRVTVSGWRCWLKFLTVQTHWYSSGAVSWHKVLILQRHSSLGQMCQQWHSNHI